MRSRRRSCPTTALPYDVPLWGQVTVHPDHHVAFQYALYSAPSRTCPPGTRLEIPRRLLDLNLSREPV